MALVLEAAEQDFDPLADLECNCDMKCHSEESTSKVVLNTNNSPIFKHADSTSKNFSCEFCGKEFTKRKNLNKHLYVHDTEKNFDCELCDKSYTYRKDLIRHMNVHKGIKDYVCEVCDKEFTCCSNLKQHVATHSDTKDIKCDICNKGFSRQSNLLRHKLVHNIKKNFKCDVCAKEYHSKYSLNRHILSHSGTFKCNHCGKEFSSNYHLNQHLVIHTHIKSFKCNICEKMFKRSSVLKKHRVIHAGVKNFKCEMCGHKFFHKSILDKHMTTHLASVNKYKCDICKKDYRSKYRLQKHMESHLGPYKCSECGKVFDKECSLTEHMNVHNYKSGFKCGHRSQEFNRKKNLMHHEISHTSAKRKTSGKDFRRHEVSQSEEKNFECDIGEEKFSLLGNLCQHKAVDVTLGRFECESCGKEFLQKGGQHRHMEKQHPEQNTQKTAIGSTLTLDVENDLNRSSFKGENLDGLKYPEIINTDIPAKISEDSYSEAKEVTYIVCDDDESIPSPVSVIAEWETIDPLALNVLT